MNTVKILIRLQADLNLRWAHMSKGTFSDVRAEITGFLGISASKLEIE